MTTLDYVDIPAGVTRLRSSKPRSSSPSGSTSSDIRPAPKIYTSLPHPSPSASPVTSHARQASFSASALASPTLSFIPQLLLSSAIPGGIGGGTSSSGGEDGGSLPTSPSNSSFSPRQMSFSSASTSNGNGGPKKPVTLLSTKDPLSLPIMSNNFRRFVSKVGPVFWLQDRIEEIMLWKRGWKRTVTWMAVYAWLCYFPRMVLLIPHAVLIGAILATYPYAGTTKDQSGAGSTTGPSQPLSAAAEGSVPWQANIQAIQNLMGAVSDAFTLAEPHVHHFILSPAHFKDPSSTTTKPSSSPNSTNNGSPSNTSNTPVSPYTLHILVLLTLTFPIIAFIIHMPYFPIRQVFLAGGLLPFVFTHPWVGRFLVLAGPHSHVIGTALWKHAIELNDTVRAYLCTKTPSPKQGLGDDEAQLEAGVGAGVVACRQPLKMVIRRLMDDDRLTDKCWNSEMREVELWENERFADTNANANSSSGNNSNPQALSLSLSKGQWSKANLRPNERSAWTRGRDGWSGVGVGALSSSGDASAAVGGVSDGQGEVSSNLTFSLAPGWLFVETEDWRKDLLGAWSGVGADPDGWVYTNDTWLGARPEPYTAAGGLGSVTRRRRWVRRVWYDQDRAEKEK